MKDILAGLDAVDWAAHEHAYGTAEDTPGRLRGALAGEEDAVHELMASLFHQGGGVCSAAVAAMPFLIALGGEPAVPERVAVLELVGMFTDLLSELAEKGRAQETALALGAVVEAALPGLAALFEDPDPAVRRTVTTIVAGCPFGTAVIAPVLRERYEREHDEGLRVAAVLAFQRLAAWMSENERAEFAAWAAGIAEPFATLAAVTALNKLAPGSIPAARIFQELESPDLRPELYIPSAPPGTSLTRWAAARFEDPEFQRLLADWTLQPRYASESGLMHVGELLWQSRQTTAELVPDIAALLDHDSAEVRSGAAHLLAATARTSVPSGDGERAFVVSPFADALAAALDDPDDDVVTRAVWALAMSGDARAVPQLIAELDGETERFEGSAHYGPLYFPVDDTPTLELLLPAMAPHADALMPAVRRMLARRSEDIGLLPAAFSAWGAAARSAVPELRALLSGPEPEAVCEMLGSIGPDAAEAAEELRRLAVADDRTDQVSAWAYLRVTGDAGPLIRRVNSAEGRHERHRAHHRLAALHAYWRATGSADLLVESIGADLEDLRAGVLMPLAREALWSLPELGAAGVRFAPLLRAVVAGPDRLRYEGGWRGIAQDDEAVERAGAALAALAALSR